MRAWRASVAAVVGAAIVSAAPSANAIGPDVLCGGQNWPVRNAVQAQAPVVCHQSKVIDGTLVTIHLNESASGFLVVSFHLATPRATPTLFHMTSHLNASDAGGPQRDPSITVAPGVQDAQLVITNALCGQIDIRAIIDSKPGRVSGPWINNDSCRPPVTTPPTTTPPTTPSSSVPSTSVVPPSSPPTEGGTVVTAPNNGHPLPATGGDPRIIVLLGVVVLGAGAMLGRVRSFRD